jgi:hypothetical protein
MKRMEPHENIVNLLGQCTKPRKSASGGNGGLGGSSKAGFSLKLDREVENHSEETRSHSEGTEFPFTWLEE